MSYWVSDSKVEMPPPPDFFVEEKPKVAPTKAKRVRMTDGHKRLRAFTIVLVMMLGLATAAGVVMFNEYKAQNKALTQCFASADANYWASLAMMYANSGQDSDAAHAIKQSKAALQPLGQNNIDDAMRACTAQFYGTRR